MVEFGEKTVLMVLPKQYLNILELFWRNKLTIR